MDDEQKEFLLVLGYFYLQNRKPAKALVLFKALAELFSEDLNVVKALSYACMLCGDHDKALSLAERFLSESNTDDDEALGRLLKGKALWGMGRREEARSTMSNFFSMKGN